MKKSSILVVCLFFRALAPSVLAELDIVPANKEGDEPVFVLKDTDSGKVMGTFWDRAKESSDYGFESSIMPDFFWSKTRDYVAVSGGASRSRDVSLFKVAGKTLKKIAVPQLSDQQAAPLAEIPDVNAEGMDVVRWQPDGTLLLRFWAAGRLTEEGQDPKEANVWADLEIEGMKAKITGTSSVEPSAAPGPPPPGPVTEEGDGDVPQADPNVFDQKKLAGKHSVIGKNPDGTTYRGTVKISVAKGLVVFEWKIGETTYDALGVMAGNTIGMVLDSGLAIYQLHGQAEGISLIGKWANNDSADVNDEVILIGQADMMQANVENVKSNGVYQSLREVNDGQLESKVVISGGANAKKVAWKTGGKTTQCEGLALGDGLLIASPGGFSVYSQKTDSFEGSYVTSKGKISQESLIPAE